jgi:hypothetical protein
MRLHGVDPSEMGPNATPEDVGKLSAFRKRLRIVSEILAIPFDELKANVKEGQLPSCVIQGVIDRYRQDTPERKGSEATQFIELPEAIRFNVILKPYETGLESDPRHRGQVFHDALTYAQTKYNFGFSEFHLTAR